MTLLTLQQFSLQYTTCPKGSYMYDIDSLDFITLWQT